MGVGKQFIVHDIEVYPASLKVARSIPNGATEIFHGHNPSGRTVALGSTQPVTEVGVKTADA